MKAIAEITFKTLIIIQLIDTLKANIFFFLQQVILANLSIAKNKYICSKHQEMHVVSCSANSGNVDIVMVQHIRQLAGLFFSFTGFNYLKF